MGTITAIGMSLLLCGQVRENHSARAGQGGKYQLGMIGPMVANTSIGMSIGHANGTGA